MSFDKSVDFRNDSAASFRGSLISSLVVRPPTSNARPDLALHVSAVLFERTSMQGETTTRDILE